MQGFFTPNNGFAARSPLRTPLGSLLRFSDFQMVRPPESEHLPKNLTPAHAPQVQFLDTPMYFYGGGVKSISAYSVWSIFLKPALNILNTTALHWWLDRFFTAVDDAMELIGLYVPKLQNSIDSVL